MAKISLKDKFAIDAQRETAEQRHVIHLFREGKFFRAFNYSAWLLSVYVYNETYRNSINAQNPISVTRNTSQNEGEYIVCGFPVHSIEKYRGGLEYNVIDENRATITMPEFSIELEGDDYQKGYEEFAAGITKKPKKTDEQRQFGKSDLDGNVRSLGMIDIIRKANNYVISEHTPIEVMLFFEEIQKDIHRLL